VSFLPKSEKTEVTTESEKIEDVDGQSRFHGKALSNGQYDGADETGLSDLCIWIPSVMVGN
jgi:hypothetical protein